MRETLKLENNRTSIALTSEVVYMQKPYWCNVTERQLKMSIIRPRLYFPYDKEVSWPLIVFLCGGAFMKMDRNVWAPELTYFAEHGYVVACVEYSVLPYTEFPEQLEEIKTAIRYLRAHAKKYGINKDQVAIMGESAGGYFAALTAATNGDPQYEKGDYLEESSEVQLAVPFYPPIEMSPEKDPMIRVRIDNFPKICDLINEKAVPMYMIHGTVDQLVNPDHSIRLYEKLKECGVSSRLTLIEGAYHADALCLNMEIKDRILEFLEENISGTSETKNEMETLKMESDGPMIGLTSEVVYMQKPYWCNVTERQLKLSIMRPRCNYPYDVKVTYPLIVFLCGGAFQKMDRNVWMAELAYFAKRGYVVAGVEYSVLPYTEHPEPLEEVKAAIRYLRANAEKFSIQKDKVIISGESAGGYLAALTAATNGDPQYEKGDYLEESSEVQLAVPFYPPVNLAIMGKPANLRVRIDNFPDISKLVNENTVPMYMIHGTVDDQVPYEQSIMLYEKLQECGITNSRLTLIEGANHADSLCYKTEIKERILAFIEENL